MNIAIFKLGLTIVSTIVPVLQVLLQYANWTGGRFGSSRDWIKSDSNFTKLVNREMAVIFIFLIAEVVNNGVFFIFIKGTKTCCFVVWILCTYALVPIFTYWIIKLLAIKLKFSIKDYFLFIATLVCLSFWATFFVKGDLLLWLPYTLIIITMMVCTFYTQKISIIGEKNLEYTVTVRNGSPITNITMLTYEKGGMLRIVKIASSKDKSQKDIIYIPKAEILKVECFENSDKRINK